MEDNKKKTVKTEWKIAEVLAWWLLTNGLIFFQNGLIWALTNDSDKWFMRISISLICLGFAGIIFRLKK